AAAQRFAALGLTATRAFRERLAPPPAAAAELPDLYDFHPGRIVLCEAADSGLAAQALRLLAADPLVDWAEPNRVRAVQLVGWSAPPVRAAGPALAATLDSLPNDPLLRQGAQWALLNPGPGGMFGGVAGDDVHAPAAWRTSVGDNALKLAYADTGIDPAQPELGGLMPDGSPRISDAINVTGEPVPAVTDSFAHGTTVAGVMAARTNDGPHFLGSGMAGVCGGDGAGNAGCRIVPIKIAPGHSGEATSFDIARAMTYAADVGARAMNLSFAGDAPSRLERLALTYATLRGCAMVCAAGNQGFNDPTLPIWPAAYAQIGICIQVGASDPSDQRVVFSSYGPGLDLLAPGVNVYTTFMTYQSYYGATYPGGYVAASGTSYSAPHVAGAVGLLAAVRPELTDDDFQHVLRESADDVGAPGVDAETGWGRLNLAAALAAVRPDLGLWHDEVPADAFAPDSSGVLAVGEGAPGTLQRFAGTSVPATRIAALAHVALPDSFLDSVRVWPRVGGTMAVRGDFSLPFFAATAQVVGQTATGFTLRGWIYSTAPDSCAGCADDYVPLAPDNVRFGFTVLGRVDRPPTVALLAPAADSAASPGDSLRLAWTATDPDTVSRV
ncbi:MAG TPA: S8 family serine peptidase, partial [Candidatus Eisenbacteria bacterium]|nr:S8 family serine peptidase [Candidatus Eisenbacteria bacterium]